MSHIVYYDVSKYQGDYNPVGPVCVRCSYGTTRDQKFSGIRSRALTKGFACLPYHYLTTGTSARNQASSVTSIVGRNTNIMVDVESGSGHIGNVTDFIDAYAAANGGGHVVLTYLPHWYWEQIGSPSLSGLTSRHSGLVSSNYTTYSDTGPGWKPYGGVTPVVWQYSTAGNLDHNAYKGDLDSLNKLWGAPLTSTPPVKPPVSLPGSPRFQHSLVLHDPQVFDSECKLWQQHCRDKWNSMVVADGYYGPYSVGVCRNIQKLTGQVEDGMVGPATWSTTFSR